MSETKCPNCSLRLPQDQLDSGWCEECGHKIPLFVYEQIGANAPDERTLSKIHWDTPQSATLVEDPEKLAAWKIVLIGAAIVCIVIIVLIY